MFDNERKNYSLDCGLVFDHLAFDLSAPETFNLDIALVKLAFPVKLNDAVNVVCLPSSDDSFPPGTHCLTAGWGHTEEGREPLLYIPTCHSLSFMF